MAATAEGAPPAGGGGQTALGGDNGPASSGGVTPTPRGPTSGGTVAAEGEGLAAARAVAAAAAAVSFPPTGPSLRAAGAASVASAATAVASVAVLVAAVAAHAGDTPSGCVGDKETGSGPGVRVGVAPAGNEDSAGRRAAANWAPPTGAAAADTRAGGSATDAAASVARGDKAATSEAAPNRQGVLESPFAAAAATWERGGLERAPAMSSERPAAAAVRSSGRSKGAVPPQVLPEVAAAVGRAPAGSTPSAVRAGGAASTPAATASSTATSGVMGGAPEGTTQAGADPPTWGTPAGTGAPPSRVGVVATPSAAAPGRPPEGLAAATLPGERPAIATATAATSLTTAAAGSMGRAANPTGVPGPSARTVDGGNGSNGGCDDGGDEEVGGG